MKIINTGLIYRNPKPHVVSRHAYFPSLALLPDGTLFAGFDLGSAFESADVRSHYALSSDGGNTWGAPIAVPTPDFPEPFSGTCRFTCTPCGSLVGVGALWDRSRADEGLANPDTGGFVETFPFLVRADASSLEWVAPRWMKTPLAGPFEICHPIFANSGGDWLWPASTWKNWEGTSEIGMKAIVMRSSDAGETWPDWHVVMDGDSKGTIYWEIKLAALPDGRLLAVCWTHDADKGVDLPIHYAISKDNGRSFSAPMSTGLTGQTCSPSILSDGRILSFYRRTGETGLWAQLSHLEGDTWINGDEQLLWGGPTHAAGLQDPKFASTAMSQLRFGLPAPLVLSDGTVMVAFWCVEDAVSVIRTITVAV